jgi:hypothetical protein
MSDEVSSYSYKPLPRGPDSIRLLHLLPHNDKDAQIHCRLVDIRLGDPEQVHPYEALSYFWGDEDDNRTISINGDILLVRRHLYEALSRLRYNQHERIIWVDAICINQENEKEKEEQIRFMPRIYNQAKNVIVWLGEEANNSDQALEAIVLAGRERAIGFSNEETVRQAVIKLLGRHWFRRIWVMKPLVHTSWTTAKNSFRFYRKSLLLGTFESSVATWRLMDMPFA